MSSKSNKINDIFFNRIVDASIQENEDEISSINSLLKISLEQKVFLGLYENLYKYTPNAYKSKIVFAKYMTVSKINKKINVLKTVLKECYKQSIFPIVLKGSALSFVIYDNLHMRDYNDLDIYVKPTDFKRFNDLLRKMGFKRESDILAEKLSLKTSQYSDYDDTKEIPWILNDIIIEAKTNSGLLSKYYFKSIFSDYQEIILDDTVMYTASVKNTFIYLLWTLFENFYCEDNFINSGYILRDIYDFISFIIKYSDIVQEDLSKDFKKSGINEYISYTMKIIHQFDEHLFAYIPNYLKSYIYVDSILPNWLSICTSNLDFYYGLFNRQERIKSFTENYFSEILEGACDKCWELTIGSNNYSDYITLYVDSEYSYYFSPKMQYRCHVADRIIDFEFLIPNSYSNLLCSVFFFDSHKKQFICYEKFTLSPTIDKFEMSEDYNYSIKKSFIINNNIVLSYNNSDCLYFYISLTNERFNNIVIANSGHNLCPNRLHLDCV